MRNSFLFGHYYLLITLSNCNNFQPFINHLKNIYQNSTQANIKPFYCTTFVIPLVKGFHLVRDMPECIKEFSKKVFLETFLLVVHFSNTILFYRIRKTCH